MGMKAASEGYSVSLEGKILQERFRIDKRIGRGGMAWLFKAEDLKTQEYVAIKLLFPHLAEDEILRARFVKESEMQFRLRHPHIVQVMTLVEEGELLGSVMEWIDGEDLKQTIARHKGPMELLDLRALCLPMLDALGYAHSSGLVHRDIKPANILLSWHNGAPVPKLTDFGIAKILEETEGGAMTSTGSALGTMRYMSPEQIRDSKNVDHRADLYSFGVVMYQLATGEPPFRGSTENLMFKQLYEPPRNPRELCPSLPAEVEQVILRCLQKKPEDRFESCPVLGEALNQAIEASLSSSGMSFDLEDEATIQPMESPRANALRPGPARTPGEGSDDEPSLPSGSLTGGSRHPSHVAADDSSANSASFSKRLPIDVHQDASSPNIQHNLGPAASQPHLPTASGNFDPQDAFLAQGPQVTIQSPQLGTLEAGQLPGTPLASPTFPPPNTGKPPGARAGVATIATPVSLPEEFLNPLAPFPPIVDEEALTRVGPQIALEGEEDYFANSSETMIAPTSVEQGLAEQVEVSTRALQTLPHDAPPLLVPDPQDNPLLAPMTPLPRLSPKTIPMDKPFFTTPNMHVDDVLAAQTPTEEQSGEEEALAPPPAFQLRPWHIVTLGVVVLCFFGWGLSGMFGDPPPSGGLPESGLPDAQGITRAPTLSCISGTRRDCYPGPKGTLNQGPCRAGKQVCQGASWGPCVGAKTPQAQELCNGIDDDCDGKVDEGRIKGVGRSCVIRRSGCRYRGRMACSRRNRLYCRLNSRSTLPGVRRVQFRISPANKTFQIRHRRGQTRLRRSACIELRSAAQRVSITAPGYALCVFPLPYREKTWYIRMQKKSLMEPAANYCIRR
jgi:serine/threonine protein kinase